MCGGKVSRMSRVLTVGPVYAVDSVYVGRWNDRDPIDVIVLWIERLTSGRCTVGLNVEDDGNDPNAKRPDNT